ncbi:phosphotransferase [Peribacillus sp. NPDC096379]|uniref:phosphotransferase n=1 Tax=Peribacillus sp. NPDC096379 TaxID=3364393 RepID=UPI0038269A83
MNTELIEKVEKIVGETNRFIKMDEQGCTSEVHQIITNNGSYVLKSSFKEKYKEWLKTEALVLEKLNNNNQIPVPKYYGFFEEKIGSHLIMSFEDGITLTSALNQAKSTTEKKSLIRSFGQFLHHFHEKKQLQYFRRENNWFEERLAKAQSYVENGQTEGNLELLNQLKSDKPIPVQQTMIHGDCTTDNVLVINGKVKLFIDVSGMTVGDPRYDESLAIGKFINNPAYIHAFYEGYRRYKVTKEELRYFEGLYEFF